MHMKHTYERHKIHVMCSGLKTVKITGMVAQKMNDFTIHFAELKGMKNKWKFFKILKVSQEDLIPRHWKHSYHHLLKDIWSCVVQTNWLTLAISLQNPASIFNTFWFYFFPSIVKALQNDWKVSVPIQEGLQTLDWAWKKKNMNKLWIFQEISEEIRGEYSFRNCTNVSWWSSRMLNLLQKNMSFENQNSWYIFLYCDCCCSNNFMKRFSS